MTQSNRTLSGGLIDRHEPINFTFNGKQLTGYAGDTVASALLANGIDIVGRSFKYGRVRGIFGSGAEEPNAILQVGSSASTTIPNLRATQTELYEGLVCSSVSGWPNIDIDFKAGLGKLAGGMMPPGFYYKTFMYPQSLWPTYEKYIRKAAGLGSTPTAPDVDEYDKMNHHCDVLIVGGGFAGLTAAKKLVGQGLRIILVDEQHQLGGALLSSNTKINGLTSSDWIDETIIELSKDSKCMILSRSTAFGYYDQNFVGVVERRTDHLGENVEGPRQRLHRIRAKKVVLASGAIERPLVYGNNDLPGNMLAGAVATYVRQYGVVPGDALLLMTTNDGAYEIAKAWVEAGKQVVAIVDSRKQVAAHLMDWAIEQGISVFEGSCVIQACGNKRVKSAKVAPINEAGDKVIGNVVEVSCDTIASSGGWSPAVHLSCHTGSKPVWCEDSLGFVPGKTVQDQTCIGGVNGVYSLNAIADQAIAEVQSLLSSLGVKPNQDLGEFPAIEEPIMSDSMELYLCPHERSISRAPKQFVDFQNDVTAAGIVLATREGFESIEHIKRYTAMGFGTDQGKTGNINGMAIAAKAMGKTIAETGTTIFRPMYTPVTFGALAGRDAGHLFDPARFTSMHKWHIEHGALFENVGQWKRPWYYPKGNETMQESLNRECLATRNSVGILDASTLGKIDIQGADAREFLNRIYTNPWSQLAPGKCRYGVMCKEDGMIFDDGVTSCINDNHFIMTTTSGGAAAVLQWLELWQQTEWPELNVYFTSVTDHWSTMTISGPNSRKLLEKIAPDWDVSNESFPYMTWQSGEVAGVKARIFRISFTGELSFEINVQANYGSYVWETIMEAGREFDITPYGTETMHILRAEKGFIIAGQDTDGSVTPQDMDMNWIVGKKKAFSYIGKRSWEREDTSRTDRKQFVGLRCKDSQAVIPEGAQAVLDPKEPVPMTMIGHVTSSYYSACLGHSIALGMIKNGLAMLGESVYFPLADGRVLEAEITSSVFYDPKGERQNVE
ncbi:sarcosine oxidase subunit alpha family protein [Vibrio penaeicida]|uniref:Sarcosine oxidase subunit alpha n=1 Tax=Vibrio penaeicida TaxID=104609 RepID=A0AAV5NYL6_9VIBR|nr:sarcosine oxidase subunit alpha family protein [Vibrio penaeicida]GLQ75652.1 sarcosine oxidase subunit alpha [Vibrio penaeicida]